VRAPSMLRDRLCAKPDSDSNVPAGARVAWRVACGVWRGGVRVGSAAAAAAAAALRGVAQQRDYALAQRLQHLRAKTQAELRAQYAKVAARREVGLPRIEI
jgi:hypothetical protein